MGRRWLPPHSLCVVTVSARLWNGGTGMKWISLGVKAVAGLLSFAVTLHAIWTVWAIDLRADPFVTCLYCIFPGLMFFVLLLVRPLRRKTALLWLLAVGYLLTASILNWRTCAELGYCSTVASTVIETFRTKPVLAAFAVAALDSMSLSLHKDQHKTDARARRRESVLK
jgi:hypothetical protein